MFSRTLRLTSLLGIEVRLDPTLLVIAVLIGWTFHVRFSPTHGVTIAAVMAAAGTFLFFGSILVHELAHGVEARHRGILVHGITLFLFGGVTEMEAHGHRPRDEFAIAAVGPWASLVCGAAFGLVATGTQVLPAAVGQPVADVAGLLGWLNVALALFNVVPGAPLDGGRLLRAGLWWLLRSRSRAITITSRIGQALGLALAGLGVWLLVSFSAALIGALWYVLVGVFLFGAARGELRSARLDEAWSSTTVLDLFPGLHTRGLEALVGDPRALPTVATDADVHTLVDAFRDHDVVLISSSGQPVTTLSEREVARRLATLRRRPRRSSTRAEAIPAGDR
ncbi:MAG: site-2 protease family protein, partial [Nitriliruptoraceae bacterium]